METDCFKHLIVPSLGTIVSPMGIPSNVIKQPKRGKKVIPVKRKNTIPTTKKEKLKALKMFSESAVHKRQMDEANEMLRLYPFLISKEAKRDQIALAFFRYMKESTVENTLKVIQLIQENTILKVLIGD